jgi:hypothetical protein
VLTVEAALADDGLDFLLALGSVLIALVLLFAATLVDAED